MPPFPSNLPQTSSSSTTDNSPSTESRPNWYDDGSTATCIDQTSPLTPQQELREIPNDQLLHEVDFNGVNDEFFLFSPGNNNDDQSVHSISDEQQDSIESPLQTSKRIYTVENQIFNDDLGLMDEFHCSSTVDPFGSNHNNNNSSMMITNLDDILIDDDDDEELKDPSSYLLNTNYRRPIQEDILYEVEHENSYSDHSQNTSSIVMPDNNVSIFLPGFRCPHLETIMSKNHIHQPDVSIDVCISNHISCLDINQNGSKFGFFDNNSNRRTTIIIDESSSTVNDERNIVINIILGKQIEC